MKKTPKPKSETTPPPAAAPAAAPASPTHHTYYPSDAARIAFLLETATEEEREFFSKLLDEWERGFQPSRSGPYVWSP